MEELRPRVVEGRRKDDSIRKATRLRELLDLVREGPGTISQCGAAHVEGATCPARGKQRCGVQRGLQQRRQEISQRVALLLNR